MSFTLGQAKLILDTDANKLISETSRAYREVQNEAKNAAEFIARQNKVREGDVKASAQIIINEAKRTAAEEAKAARDAERERIASNRRIATEFKKIEAENARQRKEIARAIIENERQIERERIASLKRVQAEEAAIRNRRIQQERADARTLASNNRGFTNGSGSFNLGNIGNTAATLLGFGAIASGAIVAREAIVGTTEAVLKQEQAIRALNAAYGDSTRLFKQAADAQAQTFQRVNSEVEQGTSAFGILQKQYGVTSDEIEKLIKISINLQSAYGGDLQQAFKDVSNAIQGEPQALEKYGIALQQNAIKNSSLLTAEEKKLYESMTAVEQARIRLRVLFADADKVEGAAAQRTKDLAGAFDAFKRSSDELARSLSEGTVPALKDVTTWATKAIDGLNAFLKEREAVLNAAGDQSRTENLTAAFGVGFGPFSGILGPAATSILAQDDIRNARARRELIAQETKNALDAIAKRDKAQRDAQAKEDFRVEQENSRLKREGQQIQQQLKDAADARLKDLEDQKRVAELERRLKLESLEERKNAELRSAEDIEQARQRASALELARIEKERNEKIKSIEASRDAAIDGIEAERAAIKDAAEENIRQLEIQKDKRIRAAEDARENALDAIEAEKQARTDARITEDRQVEDSIRNRDRALEDAHKRNLRRFEQESDAARDHYDEQIRGIDKLTDAEEDRHTKRLRQIDRERDKELDSIDKQIRAIEDAQRARENASRTRGLTRRVDDARRALTLAQGTGTPEQRNQARDKLTQALRANDPEAIKKAQEELIAISGQGAAAIEKAQQDLFDAEEELRNNNLDAVADAEKQKLQDAKDRIDKETNAEKQQEADRNTQRKRTLEADKQAAKDRLDDSLKKIDLRKKAETDAYEKDKRGAQDATEYAKRALEDRRRAEDEKYRADIERIRDTYETEQRAIKDTYDSEEKGLIPAIRRATESADKAAQARAEYIKREADKSIDEIHRVYDDPVDGMLAAHRRAEQSARDAYENVRRAITDKYEDARKAVEKAYRADDGKSGILDHIDEMERNTKDSLDETLKSFEAWEKGLVKDGGVIKRTFDEATRLANEYFDLLQKRGGQIITPRRIEVPGLQVGPDPGLPGSTTPGGGAGPNPPPTVTPTPAPGLGAPNNEDPNGIDVRPERFNTSFGFLARYTNPFNPRIPRHRGVDLVVAGAPNGGRGQPVGAFRAGTVAAATIDPNGGNGIIIRANDGLYDRYFHFDRLNVRAGQTVQRGTQIGILGESGTEGSPHLHYEVSRRINGDFEDEGDPLISPIPYMSGRDKGYTFDRPTFTYTPSTGERNVIAERGPEQLLGRVATQQLVRMGINLNRLSTDYSQVGSMLSDMAPSTTNVIGDTFNYNGVAPTSIFDQFRSDQRRQRVLRGVRQ